MFQNQSRWKERGLLIGSMLLISIMAHSFFIGQQPNGLLMKGVNDGLSQMLPFKQFIYKNYAQGNFFYADNFGIGGGIFSQLAYYFSTNIFFLIIASLLFIVESMTKYQVNLNTWVQLILPMSILKQTSILLVAYHYFKTMKLSKKAAYVGAIIYGLSPLFYRHEMYWDILTDAMFWLVLLLIGIEKIIRKESSTTFVVAVALIFINNFYLAYVNLLIGFFYIIVRFFVHCSQHELSVKKQLKRYVSGGLLGLGIGCFAFIPAAIGFLHNSRPPYKDAIPLIDLQDNIVSNPRILWLPVFIVVVLCMKKLYQNQPFRFFAIIAIGGTVLHFIPHVGSMFNGFSAPQNRWEAIVVLGYAGAFAVAVDHVQYWEVRQVKRISGMFLLFMIIISMIDPTFKWGKESIIFVMTALWMIGISYLFAKRKSQNTVILLVVIFVLGYANVFQAIRLTEVEQNSYASTKQFMESDNYNAPEQNRLIQYMKRHLSSDRSRIDWMVEDRNNTPIVQNFKGISVYSSVLNGDILNMYQKDLQIDMERESVSRYATMGARTNLMSLWQSQFYMRKNTNLSIPYHYHLVKRSPNYNVYENKALLPAFRVTNTLFSAKDLESQPVLAKEHAMLRGVITEDTQNTKVSKVPETPIKKIRTVHANWNGDILDVRKDNGGIDLHITPSPNTKDLYVNFYIEGIHKKETFTLNVNEDQTTRKKSDSIYRTGYNDLTFAVNRANLVHIRLAKGKYRLNKLHVYEESYATLADALKNSKRAAIKWQNNHANGVVNATKPHQMLVTPIPYEKGWVAHINGKKVAIEKVNYAFIGIPLTNGGNRVELDYQPPYWTICLWISFISLVLFIYGEYRQRKRINL
ncbi:YfhO family protein [Rummeliibacillus pycnus]|uniref:YfhO family protein n=1 Tax=Rummeliibacillus pycnus TaxID=101070 RepID=UPI000C9B7868|nr:YfhO family protein [Rummeliibacillus pycnus]